MLRQEGLYAKTSGIKILGFTYDRYILLLDTSYKAIYSSTRLAD
jgi:hypothetical protein